MLEKKHAEAASEAVLRPHREELARRVDETSKWKALALLRAKGTRVGGLLGVGLALLGYFLLDMRPVYVVVIIVFCSTVGGLISERRARAQQTVPADVPASRGRG